MVAPSGQPLAAGVPYLASTAFLGPFDCSCWKLRDMMGHEGQVANAKGWQVPNM